MQRTERYLTPGDLRILWITDDHVGEHAQGGQLRYLRQFVDYANAVRPDVVIHTGDFVNGYLPGTHDHAQLWYSEWEKLDPSILRIEVPGNRDYGDAQALMTEEDWVQIFGYEQRVENAGSRFIQAWSISTVNTKVRIITVPYHARVINMEGTKAWLRGEVAGCQEPLMLFCSHTQAWMNDLQALIDDEGRNDLRVIYLHGHNHGGQAMQKTGETTNITRYLLGESFSDRAEELRINGLKLFHRPIFLSGVHAVLASAG